MMLTMISNNILNSNDFYMSFPATLLLRETRTRVGGGGGDLSASQIQSRMMKGLSSRFLSLPFYSIKKFIKFK
jgi:hypothetical protein